MSSMEKHSNRKAIAQWFAIIAGIVVIIVGWHYHTLNRRKDPFTTDMPMTYKRQVILTEPDTAKEYRLSADVDAVPRTETTDSGRLTNLAWIEKVYWPNGGYTTFDNNRDSDACSTDRYNLGHPIKCYTTSGNTKSYEVELLAPTN